VGPGPVAYCGQMQRNGLPFAALAALASLACGALAKDSSTLAGAERSRQSLRLRRSAASAVRPAWGRDFGVGSNAGALPSRLGGGVEEHTANDADGAEPGATAEAMAAPGFEILFRPQGRPLPASPAIAHGRVPVTPKGAADWSPSDPAEGLAYGLDKLAGSLPGVRSAALDPASIVRERCEQVCQECTLTALEHTGGAASCNCFANCVVGADRTQCEEHVDGWTKGDMTAPLGKWRGACNAGDRHCASECLSRNFIMEVQACSLALVPAVCYANVRKLLSKPLETDFRYCYRRDLGSCEAFTSLPERGARWRCFQSIEDCEENRRPGPDLRTMAMKEPPSAWETVQ